MVDPSGLSRCRSFNGRPPEAYCATPSADLHDPEASSSTTLARPLRLACDGAVRARSRKAELGARDLGWDAIRRGRAHLLPGERQLLTSSPPGLCNSPVSRIVFSQEIDRALCNKRGIGSIATDAATKSVQSTMCLTGQANSGSGSGSVAHAPVCLRPFGASSNASRRASLIGTMDMVAPDWPKRSGNDSCSFGQ
jgi:hypothetical protein